MEGNSKDIERIAQGSKSMNIIGTNTIFFKHHNEIPPGKKPTYLRVVAAYRPTKEDPYKIRWTVGGNLISYSGHTYTPNADLTTTKILFNSVISTDKARFMTIDIANFYLNSELDTYEYMLIPVKMIPQDIFDEYKLQDKVHKGHVLAEIQKGMYGLPQAGRIAYVKLLKHLAKGGYVPA